MSEHRDTVLTDEIAKLRAENTKLRQTLNILAEEFSASGIAPKTAAWINAVLAGSVTGSNARDILNSEKTDVHPSS